MRAPVLFAGLTRGMRAPASALPSDLDWQRHAGKLPTDLYAECMPHANPFRINELGVC